MKLPRIQRGFKRHGPDYRFGDQVDFAEIKYTFGFKTMTIGHWVKPEEKHISANLIYDALADLAQILQLPPTTIGLRNTLNFAFGSGGQPGVQAHYCASSNTLALAKNAGGGALAHEWWHAFDHYICQHLIAKPSHGFASAAWLRAKQVKPHALNRLLDNYFSNTFLQPDKQRPSDFFSVAKVADQANKQIYYAMPEELSARMFETIIAYHGDISNDFLVSRIKHSELERLGLYPSQKHLARCAAPLLGYFNELGKILYRQNH